MLCFKLVFNFFFMSFLKELISFLKSKSKLWLLPVIILMIIIGGLIIFAEGSVMAPFIYTLF